MITCSIHPDERAAWLCSGCGKDLCPECVAEQRLMNGTIIRCMHCGGASEPILMRKEVKPYWGLFQVFFLNMFKVDGLFQLFGMGALLAVLGWMASLPSFYSLFASVLYMGFFASYYFLVINKTAYGDLTLPQAADFGNFWEVGFSAFRFIAAISILWVPAMLYILRMYTLREFLQEPDTMLSDPVLIAIVILAVLYCPGAIITTAITSSFWAMLNPFLILGIALRIPGQYFVTVIAWGILNVVNVYFKGPLGWFAAAVPIPFLTAWLVESIGLVLPLMGAFMLGRLLYQNGEILGFTSDRDLMEPVFPGAKPKGAFREQDFERSRGSAAGAAAVAAIELESEPSAPADPNVRLEAALDGGDNQGVLQAYETLAAAGQAPQLEPRLELRLANLLERDGRSLDAAHACRRAAQADLKGPFATRAIFTTARLLTDKVGDREQGITMYRYLVDNYPDDEMSLRAAEMLRRLQA